MRGGARRRSLYGERAAEGANDANGPFSRRLLVFAAAAGEPADNPKREQADSDREQDSVVRHLEDSDQHDAEAGERDDRPRHHQAETGFLSHVQMTASRRSRSISSAP